MLQIFFCCVCFVMRRASVRYLGLAKVENFWSPFGALMNGGEENRMFQVRVYIPNSLGGGLYFGELFRTELLVHMENHYFLHR